MKLLKVINSILDSIINTIIIIVLLISIYAVYDIFSIYNESILDNDIIKYTEEEIVDIKKLKEEINEDICGWLRIDGTNINYPLLHSNNEFEYLDKNYKKEFSITGSLFLDTNNSCDFSDDYSIIYGHNAKAKVMFSDIINYEKISYFNKFNKGKIYTIDKEYDLYMYSYSIFESSNRFIYDVKNIKNNYNEKIINIYNQYSYNRSEMNINSEDKLVALSTCNDMAKGTRSVLLCKIEEHNN